MEMHMHMYIQIFIDAYTSIFLVYYAVSFLNILPDSEINTLTGHRA